MVGLKIARRHRGGGIEPGRLSGGQRAFDVVAVSVKTQHGQFALARTGARTGQILEQQLLAQHGVRGFSQCVALAGPQVAVFAEKTGHHGIGRVVKLQYLLHQGGAGV